MGSVFFIIIKEKIIIEKDYATEEIKLFNRIVQKYIDHSSDYTLKYFWQTNSYVFTLNGSTLKIMYLYNIACNDSTIKITFYPKSNEDISRTLTLDDLAEFNIEAQTLIGKILKLTKGITENKEEKNLKEFIEATNNFLNNN